VGYGVKLGTGLVVWLGLKVSISFQVTISLKGKEMVNSVILDVIT